MGWRFSRLFLFAGALLAAPVSASAQAAPAPQASRAFLGPTDFLNAALFVVSAIDRYDMASTWDSSSAIMKSSIPKDRFIASTAQRRAALGGVQSRDWNSIMKINVAQKGTSPLPPGRYMSIRFTTIGQSGSALEEVVSFRLDDDGQWRLAGYTVQ